MLWDVFATHLSKVPLDSALNLSKEQVEAFIFMFQHSIATRLAEVTKNFVPSYGLSGPFKNETLLTCLADAVKACKTYEDLSKVEELRHEMYCFQNATLKLKVQVLEK